MTTALIDTNVLVYAHDPSDAAKADRALELLDHLQSTGEGGLSAQILAEFYVVAVRGSDPLLTQRDACQQVALFSRSFVVHSLTPMIVLEACRGVADHSLSYWDSQVWAAAKLNQVPVIFSEDFQHNAVLEGVRFINPFAVDSPVAALL